MQRHDHLDFPVREVIVHSAYDNMLTYISMTAFLAMTAVFLMILSL